MKKKRNAIIGLLGSLLMLFSISLFSTSISSNVGYLIARQMEASAPVEAGIVGGVGAMGGLMGAKYGATIGTAGGPIGAVVGAAVGGM